MRRSIRIISNSHTPVGTKIVYSDTGEEINLGVTGLTIDMSDVNSFIKAVMNIACVNVDTVAGRSSWSCINPLNGQFSELSSIKFKDGIEVEFDDIGTPYIKASTNIMRTGLQYVSKSK